MIGLVVGMIWLAVGLTSCTGDSSDSPPPAAPETVAGIDVDESRPGYKHILFRPQPGGGLTHARARLKSMYGVIELSGTSLNTLLPRKRGTGGE